MLNLVLGIGFVVLLIVLIIVADRLSESDGGRNVTDQAPNPDKAVKYEADDSPIWYMVCFGIGIFVLWALTPWVMSLFYDEPQERGQAGDLFGSINALFAGFAFAGVIYAILLQRKELMLQREELKLTRRELKRSADAQEKSHKALQATTHAQTMNVVLGILDSEKTVEARQHVWGNRDGIKTNDTLSKPPPWSDLQKSAEEVVRGFEAVGGLVKFGLLPEDYILSTRSENISQYWSLLKSFVQFVREERRDPDFGSDFQYLSELAKTHMQGRSADDA